MDNLNYFRKKFGYSNKQSPYSTDERLKKEKAQSDWDWMMEEGKRKEEERRRIEERRAKMEALQTLADSKTDIKEQSTDLPSSQELSSGFNVDTPFVNRGINIFKTGSKPQRPNPYREFTKEQQEKILAPHRQFSIDFRKDINDNIAMQKALGVKDEDISKSLIPPEDTKIQERLDYITSKIKPGKEKLFYNIREGWYEREIQNMLSKEYVRKMNGLPNNVDLIEEFLRENPEISAHESNDDNIIRKFFSKGVRFLGSGTRLQYDSYKESAKDPMSYVWAGTILAASIMAAPVTGGASLAAAPLAASSPLLVSQMPLLTKTIASLKPVAALTFGMKHGALKNMAELEAGSAYKEYLEEGIDHRIAAPIATTVGTFNGIIEYMQIDSALSAIPGVTELVENGSKMAQKQLVKEITKVMANYGVDLGSNVIEEMAQAGTAELGLELSRYLQDTPNPRTIDGLKVLGKTMTKKDFWDTVLEEGYGALQSMWLSPIVSSAGRVTVNQTLKGMANTAEKAQITKQLDLEERQTREAIKHDMDYILEKDGATDQAIRMINETRDPRAMEFLMAEQQILEDILQREDVTNQDKARIEKTLDKVKNVVSKVMYETKEENRDIEYLPTNAQDVEQEILSEGFLDNNEIYNESLNNYTLELYKLADNHNVLNTIKEELTKGTNKAEIMDKITKTLPRKIRKPLDVMAMINSVDTVQNEIKAQIIMNNLYNLEEIRNDVSKEIIIDETLIENKEDQVVDEDAIKTDLTEGDLREDKEVGIPIPLTEDKNLATEPQTTPDNFKDDLVAEETISGEIDTEIEDKSTTKEFKPSDIVTVPIEKINVDPERFQFRYDKGNEGGATKKLVGAEYNPMLAGTILLWEDEYNDLYVVNGHHRVDLAKNSDIKEMESRIISYNEYTAEEARALGAMINIAEDNATSIDVAKLIRDTGVTESDFKEIGIRPNSKVAKDGIALSKLNDWIFAKVATRAIPIERAIIIGNELGDNPDGQNQIIKAIDKIENRGKNITNDVLIELIAEVKGTAREKYTEMTLFGEETFTKNYSLERAELVSYVKRQLKDRVSLLKNVSKNKNAAILQELGNTIAVDDNVKEMNVADQALWILDKTLNYQGTKTNKLFNELAKEYAEIEPANKNKVKKKALNELITLMEGGQLLNETINQEVKREGIKDSIINARTDGEGGQSSYGLSESELENQVNLFGEDTIMQLKELPDVKVVADENTKQTTSFKATIPIVEAIKKNPMFNGLTVKYSNESGKVETMSKEDLINHGYGHLEEKGEKYIYGFYNDGDRTITLNQEATRDTILEEAIHDIQYRLEQIDPELAVLVNEWENEVREQAKEHGITIPDGYELLAQSLVYTEFGYASTNPFIANLIAVDDEIVNKFKAILGDDIAERGFGFVDSEVEKSERLLKSKYENHAKRMFTQDGYIKNIIEAENKRKSEIKGELKKARAATYYHPSSGNYVIVHPSVKGHKYQVTYFSPELGPLMDSQFDTIDEVADRLIEDKMYYKANEIHYQLKNQYDRSVADELYERFYLQGGQRKDSDSRTSRTNVSVEIDGRDIRRVKEAINKGNFTLKDYQELIEGNKNLVYDTRKYLKELVDEARKKGLDRPNKEVSLKQFLYRFYGAEIEADTEISNDDIRKYWLYSIDRAIEKKGYDRIREEQLYQDLIKKNKAMHADTREFFIKLLSEQDGIDNIKNRLKEQHKYFQNKIDTYRHRGLYYQIKPMDEKVNSPEFKQWFGNSKIVDEKGQPLVVYHGTKNTFSVFDADKISSSSYNRGFYGKGFYFTYSKTTAQDYARSYKGINAKEGNVIEAYLSVQKPFIITNDISLELLEKYTGDTIPQVNKDIFKNNPNVNIVNLIGRNADTFTENLIKDGYDGVIYKNILTDVVDGEFVDRPVFEEIVVFNPTQIKSIDNVGTFSEIDPNIYYQLKDDEVALNEIDGTDGDLLAMHNITVNNLEKAIELGGFPMPSIAVTKKDIPFTDFGDISLIFNKETINPENELNKVFGGDAWTPIFPSIYKSFLGLGDDYLKDKDGNMYPVTIENVLKVMQNEGAIRNVSDADETTKLIVNAIPEYKTLDEIRADSDRLMPKEYDVSNVVTDIIQRYSKGITEYLKPDAQNKYFESDQLNSADYLTYVEILNTFLDKAKNKEMNDLKMEETFRDILSGDFNNVPDKHIENMVDIIIYLQNTPTDMFEAKPVRVVGINEIQAAAINVLNLSRDEFQKAEELLNSIGINVIEKYTGRYEDDRQRAIDEILRQKDLAFQIKETDTSTKEFKDWFADSKIVDEEGKPIKAYHGTIQKFSSFKAGDIGFHFGNKDQAMDRIDDLTGDTSIADEPLIDENAMPVYLNIKNPIKLDIDLGNWNANYRLTDVLLERGLLTEEEAREIKEIKNYDMEGYTSNANKKLREILMAKGYDGIVYDNWFESEGDSYIAFYPNQIKSVYNQGTWSANSPNIYYQLKNEVDLKERSWGQTVRDSDITSQELKDLLTSNKFIYEVKHNEDTILAAAKLIDEKGEAWVEARLLSELENDAVLFAASQILTYKYMETGEFDRAMSMLDKTAEKATSAGQAIQILSVWGRQTPDGMLRYTANRFSKAITEEQKQKVIETTNKLKTEFNKINQEALNNIDITGAIKAVDEMPLQELVTRKLAKSKEGQGLIDKYGLENILKTLENKEMKEIAEIDRETLKPFLDGKTSIDDSMADKIVEVVNEHYKEGKGNLKNKLSELGLNDFEVEILHMYIKNQMKEYAKDKKMSLIDELPRQKYERKGIDQQILDLIADGEIDENILKNLVGEKEGLPVLSKDLIDYIYQQGQHINSLEEGSRERDVATAKLMSEIASHMPTNFWNKIATIQTMAHLLNVRTTLRNLIGNELFSKIDTITHNYLGAPIDKLVSVKTKQRTAIHRNIFKLLQTQYKGYGEGFRLGLEDALMGIDTFDEKSKFEIKKTRTFKGGILGSLETVLDITMRATDRAAFTAAFMDSIEEQMKIAGVNAPTEQMIDNATALGLYRTFNDETALSEAFRGGKRALNKFSSYITGTTDFGLGDLVLKYPSTPANILARAVDYSPVGVITTMLELYKDTSGDSYIRQKMAVEGLSRALAGTSLIATGMILAKMGVITGSDSDDDEDIYKLQKQYGLKDYSVNVSAIKRHFESAFKSPTAGELKHGDTLATYDWIEPMAIPLAVGADTVLGKGDALSLLDTIVNATEKGVTALAEQPLLTGLTRLFGYGDPVEGVSSAVLDIPSSFTPTLLAHIAAFMDGSSKDYYSFYSKGRRAYNAVLNKIPGTKSKLPDKFSVLGEKLRYYPEDTGAISRILRTIVSPANHGKYEPSEEAQFIFDLYEKTGMTEHIPRKLQKSYTIDGAKYTFTPEEYEKLSKWTGEEVRKRISYALNTYMGGWSPEEQVDEIRWIINELGKEAKEKFIEMKGIEQ